MEISVLGPLAVTHNGMSLVPTASKPRTLLALLASYEGRVAPLDVIIDELWEDDPPTSSLTTTQTYVLQLRRLIEKAAKAGPGGCPKEILRTEPSGYALDQSQGTLDTTEFTRLADHGHDAFQARDFQTARTCMEAALGLWRGPAYIDVMTGPRLSAHATLLEESRKTLRERRIAADLQLGLHHELIGELAGLTAEHTTDEQLHAHFMVALYRSGRRDEAISVFTRLRSALATDLGVDPAPDMDQLYRSILSADPDLHASPGGLGDTLTSLPHPRGHSRRLITPADRISAGPNPPGLERLSRVQGNRGKRPAHLHRE